MRSKLKARRSRESRFKRTRLKFLCIADETENLSSVDAPSACDVILFDNSVIIKTAFAVWTSSLFSLWTYIHYSAPLTKGDIEMKSSKQKLSVVPLSQVYFKLNKVVRLTYDSVHVEILQW